MLADRSRLAGALLVAVVAGCGCDEPPPVASATPPSSPEAALPAEPAGAPAEPGAATERSRPARPPPRREELSEHARHLREGRRAAHEERWADAVRELTQADEAGDGGSRARGELGWALYHVGELARASELTREALELVEEPRRRAMLLYNLGRILEDLGEREGAEDAYVASLRERPNDVVRSRLSALRPEAIERLDPDRAAIERVLEIPTATPTDASLCDGYPTPEEYDALLDDETAEPPEDDTRCEIAERAVSADGRFEAVVRALTSEWQTSYSLYLRSGEAWVDAGVSLGESGDGWESGRVDSSERTLRIVETPAGPIVEIRVRIEGNDDDWCEGYSWRSERLAWCGPIDGSARCFGVVTLEDELEVHEGRIAYFEEDELSDDADLCESPAIDPGVAVAAELVAPRLPAVSLDDTGTLAWDEAPPALSVITDPRRLPCVLTPAPAGVPCP